MLLKTIAKQIKAGDRVTWIVFTLLVLISMVAIFSSTSTMAISRGTSRMNIFLSHLKIVGIGGVIVLGLNAIPSVKFFRSLSASGFIVSLFLLLCLIAKIHIGSFLYVEETHKAVRAITVGGFNLAVYEVVKVAMVMYLAWAVHEYEGGRFALADSLGTTWPRAFGWMKDSRALLWIYIFCPILIICTLTLKGSSSSAIIVYATCLVTIIVGGVKFRQILHFLGVTLLGCVIVLMVHILSDGERMSRLSTMFTRFKIELPYPDSLAREHQRMAIQDLAADESSLKPGTKDFRDALDSKLQAESALVAVVEGGEKIVGKGPGKSTQKYICPIIFEDYMYSLIIEEYGLVGAALILILYLSLFARGMILVHNCNYRYAKACMGGIVFLITGQALFHILVNCHIGLVSGQTLPLISHGRCSFLCFCIAFGVLLSISVQVNNKVKKQQAEEARLVQKAGQTGEVQGETAATATEGEAATKKKQDNESDN